jgi:hypothetical protein
MIDSIDTTSFVWTCIACATQNTLAVANLVAGTYKSRDKIGLDSSPSGDLTACTGCSGKPGFFRTHDYRTDSAAYNGLHRWLVDNSQIHTEWATELAAELMPTPDYTVADEAAMLLTGAAHDEYAYRQDVDYTFQMTGADPTLIGDWTQLEDARPRVWSPISATTLTLTRLVKVIRDGGTDPQAVWTYPHDLVGMLKMLSVSECLTLARAGRILTIDEDPTISAFAAAVFGDPAEETAWVTFAKTARGIIRA